MYSNVDAVSTNILQQACPPNCPLLTAWLESKAYVNTHFHHDQHDPETREMIIVTGDVSQVTKSAYTTDTGCMLTRTVVISGPFIKNFPCNHSVNINIIIFFFRRSKRQRNFSLFYFASQES
jgi:hypothetical protein